MKSKIIYFLIMLVGLLACKEEFTEAPAYGALSDAALQNAQGVDLNLIGAYSLLDGMSNTGNSDWEKAADGWWYDVMADDAHKGSNDGDQADLTNIEKMDWQTTNPYFEGRWKSLFAGVNRSNAVLDLITKIEGGDFSQQTAEARFLRGHYNFEIQKMWGNVPYISEENYANTEFNQPNPGPIWDQIEADFKYAMDNLPNSQSDVGRPNSWVAMAFLGKVHLYQSEWADAKGYLEGVINSGVYSLLPEFVDNFRIAGDNSSESLLAIQYTSDSGQSFNANRGGTLNFNGPFNCCGFYQPTQDLVNVFQTTSSGLPLLDAYNQNDVANDYGINSDEAFELETGPLDPRLDYTVGRRGIEYNGWGLHPGKEWIRSAFIDLSGPYSAKKNAYYAGEDANMGTGSWGEQRAGINYHLMRYADVLLMAAEAAVETNDLPAALNYVNQVRNRAKDMTYVKTEDGTADAANYVIEPYGSFADQAFARKAVRMERRLELGVEGHRLFDIRRWGVAIDVMNAYFVNEGRVVTSFLGDPAPFEAKHNLTPIPLNAIDLSGAVLQQNPGY